jgi:hypothetical protein
MFSDVVEDNSVISMQDYLLTLTMVEKHLFFKWLVRIMQLTFSIH